MADSRFQDPACRKENRSRPASSDGIENTLHPPPLGFVMWHLLIAFQSFEGIPVIVQIDLEADIVAFERFAGNGGRTSLQIVLNVCGGANRPI